VPIERNRVALSFAEVIEGKNDEAAPRAPLYDRASIRDEVVEAGRGSR